MSNSTQHHTNVTCGASVASTTSGTLSTESILGVQDTVRANVSDKAGTRSVGVNLPVELVQKIYWHLGPTDFNAARHTCRLWFASSLRLQLLVTQLKRGGWCTYTYSQPLLLHDWERVWPTSCYLARECSLARNYVEEGVLPQSRNIFYRPMVQAVSIDFTSLKDGMSNRNESLPSASFICTVSLCGMYTVIASGPEMYIYGIEHRSIRLVRRISCENKVVAAAISAAPGKLVIAAILESRIGLYIDLFGRLTDTESTRSDWETSGTITHSESYTAVLDFETGDGADDLLRSVGIGDFEDTSLNATSLASRDTLHHFVETGTRQNWSEYFHGQQTGLRGMRRILPLSSKGSWPKTFNVNLGKSKGKQAVEQLPLHIVYRNICTSEDPPCSIAISPTRQCLAFGCKAGVELYWIDPNTGQNLNRWFCLAKPSDHLYFLPPRRYKDNSQRLRLISTSTYESSTDDTENSNGELTSQTSFWFTLTRSWHLPLTRASRQEVHCADHCYAVPLSDGHHILFTDSETGLLCLGSNTPTGAAQRLSRKFVFEPPEGLVRNGEPIGSTVYAAANDLSNGVRIAAAYGDQIVLYSVPVDMLSYSTAEQEQTLQDAVVPFDELELMSILKHSTSNAQAIREREEDENQSCARFEELNMRWVHYLTSKPETLDDLWPLKVSGTNIGSLESVKSLSIQGTVFDGLFVWAFSSSGMGRAWRLNNGECPSECSEQFVDCDGMIWESSTPYTDNVLPTFG